MNCKIDLIGIAGIHVCGLAISQKSHNFRMQFAAMILAICQAKDKEKSAMFASSKDLMLNLCLSMPLHKLLLYSR